MWLPQVHTVEALKPAFRSKSDLMESSGYFSTHPPSPHPQLVCEPGMVTPDEGPVAEKDGCSIFLFPKLFPFSAHTQYSVPMPK